jgi:hypothetical protein
MAPEGYIRISALEKASSKRIKLAAKGLAYLFILET